MPTPSRELSQVIEDQIDDKLIKRTHKFTINGVDHSDSLEGWNISVDRRFGANSATFTLVNTGGRFGDGGDNEINVGDEIQLIEQFSGDTVEWKKFFGLVVQRSIRKTPRRRAIVITCLDFISTLQQLDIDLIVEGVKVEVIDEVLTPNFLPEAPTADLAQIFDFANNSLADDPRVIILIRDNTGLLEDFAQFDGFDINFQQGQLILGSPLSAATNYSIVARTYHYYVEGVFAEDVLEKILLEPDGYGNFLFGESTAQAVIDNHLTETFENVEGVTQDFLTPNLIPLTIPIKHNLVSDVSEGASSITLDSVEGFPSSGEGEINGDIFTWSSIDSGNVLNGIPTSGSTSLKAHSSGDIVSFEITYASGQVWSLKYSNVLTNLTSGDFTIPEGTLNFFDKRFGRILLSSAISLALTVSSNVNYSFKTLQASGIELNKISFRSRELENRYAAVEKLRKFITPNYIIRTIGDNKIWSSFLGQKFDADYTLKLIKDINYLEDEDLITRVVFFGKNNNPTNLMFGDSVNFNATGQPFKSQLIDGELVLDREEGDFFVFKPGVLGVGYIDVEVITPTVKINGVLIDNRVHILPQQPVQVELKTRTETRTGCHGISKESYFKQHTYFYYKILFTHSSIAPSESIRLFDARGITVLTISPNDINMDYGRGVYHVPGDSQNTVIQSISTAQYGVLYATSSLVIDYDEVEFKIRKSLLPRPQQARVTATFEFFSVFTQVFDVAAIVDGRFDTQVQTEFFAEPPSGFPLAIIDLGSEENIQAVDIVAGFYRPDTVRKFDIDMRFSLKSSKDGVNFAPISDKTDNIRLSGGESISFEEEDLGVGFSARFLQITIDRLRKIEFGQGRFVAAFVEIAAYNNIIIKADAKLIPTTQLADDITAPDNGGNPVPVVSTEGFDDSGTIFIDGDQVTYTGKTATSFTGMSGIEESGISGIPQAHLLGDRVHKELEGDDTLFDDDGLLPRLSDRTFKQVLISDDTLFSQATLNSLARAFLREFYKDHNKRRIRVMYAPYLQIGQTISLTDPYNNETNVNYFVESVTDVNGAYELIVAKYPAT